MGRFLKGLAGRRGGRSGVNNVIHTSYKGTPVPWNGNRAFGYVVIFYEIDQDSVKTVLRLEAYGGEEEASWVLLESDGADAGPSDA